MNAAVPIIIVEIDGFSVDLLFVSVDSETIPDRFDPCDESYSRALASRKRIQCVEIGSALRRVQNTIDADGGRQRAARYQDVMSLNGVRVTEHILRMLPQGNLAEFQTATRMIKMWADCAPSCAPCRPPSSWRHAALLFSSFPLTLAAAP